MAHGDCMNTMVRMRIRCLIGLLICITGTTGAASAAGRVAPYDVKQVQAISERMEQLSRDSREDYLAGRPQAALKRMHDAIDPDDWQSQLVAANMIWTMHPADSLAWHTQAYERSGQAHEVLLELVLHAMRREDCDAALPMLATLDKGGEFGGYFPMLAGYCHLKRGDAGAAYSMFKRAELGRHSRFGSVLDEIWGPRPGLVVHAERLAAYREAPSDATLGAAIDAAVDVDGSRPALLRVAGAVPSHDTPSLRELRCLRPLLEPDATRDVDPYDERPTQATTLWRNTLKDCRLLGADAALPQASTLARWLVGQEVRDYGTSAKDLLAAHGAELDRRARSTNGDLAALKLLAALQLAADDRVGLDASDMLGWERYRLGMFAASRLLSQARGDKTATPELLQLAARARADFPTDGDVVYATLISNAVPDDQRAEAWRIVALHEFHGTRGLDSMHMLPDVSRLYEALREYRTLVPQAQAAWPAR